MVEMLVREQEVREPGSFRQLAEHPVGHAHGGIHRHIAICSFDEIAVASHRTTCVYLYLSAHARIIAASCRFGEPKVRQYPGCHCHK